MRRNFNLELGLLPSLDPTQQFNIMQEPKRQQPRQQLTIFYDGKVCVCDVTELQARAILFLANGSTEEKSRTPSTVLESSFQSPLKTQPQLQPQHLNSPTPPSMQKSLQRFFQRRKNRSQSTSPY